MLQRFPVIAIPGGRLTAHRRRAEDPHGRRPGKGCGGLVILDDAVLPIYYPLARQALIRLAHRRISLAWHDNQPRHSAHGLTNGRGYLRTVQAPKDMELRVDMHSQRPVVEHK
jgi:hypothetical protein